MRTSLLGMVKHPIENLLHKAAVLAKKLSEWNLYISNEIQIEWRRIIIFYLAQQVPHATVRAGVTKDV